MRPCPLAESRRTQQDEPRTPAGYLMNQGHRADTRSVSSVLTRCTHVCQEGYAAPIRKAIRTMRSSWACGLGVTPGERRPSFGGRLCFHRHKDYRRSIQFSDAVLERDPDYAYAHWLKTRTQQDEPRKPSTSTAQTCLKRIDSGGPKGFEDAVHDTLAEVYLSLDEPEQSRLPPARPSPFDLSRLRRDPTADSA